jgi:hypothetical protein
MGTPRQLSFEFGQPPVAVLKGPTMVVLVAAVLTMAGHQLIDGEV